MTDRTPPVDPQAKPDARAARQALLAEQLRANLHRRKAQARARQGADPRAHDLPKA